MANITLNRLSTTISPADLTTVNNAGETIATTLSFLIALTEEERTRVRDVSDRGEAWAAELVEAEHHRDLRGAQARGRRIAWLARVLRARVEAMRAQDQAAQALTATVALRAAVTERRAARDRASEALVAAERQDAVSTRTLPAPDADASVMVTADAATAEAGR